MNEFDFARAFLIDFKVKGDEIIPRYCPICKGGPHKDKDTFALNYKLHVYKCQRGSCGEQGHFSQLCKRFSVEADQAGEYSVPVAARRYKRPEVRPGPPTDAVTSYIRLRGITDETAAAFGVGSHEGNIMFPYYRVAEEAEAGTPVFVKYRAPRKLGPGERKMWREADTEPILFGMQLCTANDPTLYIFEGEFDCMCGYQATGKNCVSVPSGCEDFTWVDTCYEWLKRFEEIAVFADNDAPGKKMLAELSKKLDFRLLRPEFSLYGSCKDANEIMVRMGPASLRTVMETMRPVEVQGLLNLADVESLDVAQLPHVQTGIAALDKATGGMYYGDLSVWTGKRGEGKSTLLSQILLDSIEQGVNVCAYSGEMPANRLKYIINLQAAGSQFVKTRLDDKTGREISYIDKAERRKIESWYSGKFWLYDNHVVQQADETDTIMRIFELAYRRYDCRVFLVDNLMTVNSTSKERDALQIQADFTVRLRRLAERLGVHIHLVAHPRKTDGEIKDSDAVSGLSAITNIASNVFSVHRCTEKEKAEKSCGALLSCLKNRMYGELGQIRMNYDPRCRRFAEVGSTDLMYSWVNQEVESAGGGDLPF